MKDAIQIKFDSFAGGLKLKIFPAFKRCLRSEIISIHFIIEAGFNLLKLKYVCSQNGQE